MMFARYLLEHPDRDPNWESHVRSLIAYVEGTFSVTASGANTIKEQGDFMHPMGSHTSRYASVNALLYARTGDLAAKEKAYRSFNWATYMDHSNGVNIDGPEVGNEWFTDGYGDYIRHFHDGNGRYSASGSRAAKITFSTARRPSQASPTSPDESITAPSTTLEPRHSNCSFVPGYRHGWWGCLGSKQSAASAGLSMRPPTCSPSAIALASTS